MAAALPTLQPGLTDRGWPSWFVSLAEHPPSPVRRYTNVVLGDPRGLRQLGLSCEAGKVAPRGRDDVQLLGRIRGLPVQRQGIGKRARRFGALCRPASLVLEGYRRWGEVFLSKLRGLFALVLWDAERDLLCMCAGCVWKSSSVLRQRRARNLRSRLLWTRSSVIPQSPKS